MHDVRSWLLKLEHSNWFVLMFIITTCLFIITTFSRVQPGVLQSFIRVGADERCLVKRCIPVCLAACIASVQWR
jgi:hypothetical protein